MADKTCLAIAFIHLSSLGDKVRGYVVGWLESFKLFVFATSFYLTTVRTSCSVLNKGSNVSLFLYTAPQFYGKMLI